MALSLCNFGAEHKTARRPVFGGRSIPRMINPLLDGFDPARRPGSIEELAASVKLHPKVVRNEIRLAFLAPEISEAILTAGCAYKLPDLRKTSAL